MRLHKRTQRMWIRVAAVVCAVNMVVSPVATLAGGTVTAFQGSIFNPNDVGLTNLGAVSLVSGNKIEFDTTNLRYRVDTTGTWGSWIVGDLGYSRNGSVQLAVFDFSSISLVSGVTVTVTGSRGLALLSQGNATIGATISLAGGSTTYGAPQTGGGGGAGGGTGGNSQNYGVSTAGSGLGGGGADSSNTCGGGGGGFGGAGGGGQWRGNSTPTTTGGPAYGDNLLTDLYGGSGGGGAKFAGGESGSAGGGGGGAIEISAVGSLTVSDTISVAGGTAGGNDRSGGGGSGGAILLSAGTASLSSATLALSGGLAGYTGNWGSGGGGGGGRLAVYSSDTFGSAPGTTSLIGGTGFRSGAAGTFYDGAQVGFNSLYWKNNAGNGVWSPSDANWNSASDGSGSEVNWSAPNTAVFAAGSHPGGAYAVSLNSTVAPTGIVFGKGSPTITNGGSGQINLGAGGLTVQSSSGAVTISVPVVLSAATEFASNGMLVVGGNVSGSYNLTFSGAGTTKLTVSNSYVNTTIGAGTTLQIGDGGTVGTLGSGTVANAGTLTFNRTDNYGGNLSNNISGAGTINVSGTGGTLTLAGANTYTGPLNITAGSVVAGSTGAIPSVAVTVTSPGVLDVNGKAISLSALSGNGTVTNNGSATTLTLASTITAGTLLQNGTGTLAISKTGTGTAIFSNSNTYSGGTTVSSGTLGTDAATVTPSPAYTDNATPFGSGTTTVYGTLRVTGGIMGGSTWDNVVLKVNSTFQIDGAASGDRFQDSKVISLDSFTMYFNGDPGSATSTSETVGTVNYGGSAMLQINRNSGAAASLTVADFARTGKGTLLFKEYASVLSAASGNINKIIVSGWTDGNNPRGLVGATTVNMISPRFVDIGTGTLGTVAPMFMDYDVVQPGLIKATATSTWGTGNIPAGLTTGTAIVQFGGDPTLTYNPDIYALRVDGAGYTAGTAGTTITVRSGGVILNYGDDLRPLGPNLKFYDGANYVEGVIWGSGSGGQYLGLKGTLQTDKGITFTNVGAGRIYVGADNSATLSGPITISRGIVAISDSTTQYVTGGSNYAFGNNTCTLDIGALGTFDVNTRSPFILGLTGNGSVTTSTNTGGTYTLTVSPAAAGDQYTFSGVISDKAADSTKKLALTKNGLGTQVLTGANTYTGATTINAGALLINDSLDSQTSAVTVNDTGTLGGSGTIIRPVTVNSGGHLAPGGAIGTLTVGTSGVNKNVAVTTGTWDLEFNGTTGTTDKLYVNGNLTWSGTQTINLTNLGSGTTGSPYTFAEWTGTGTTPVGTWNVVSTAGANHWIAGDSTWDTPANWNPTTTGTGTVALSGKTLQLTPSSVAAVGASANVFIDPNANVNVTGPASGGGHQTVQNLTIGQGIGTYTAVLTLASSGNLTVAGITTVRSDGTLTATTGGLITPTLNTAGNVTLGNAADNITTANISAGTLTYNNVGTAALTANLSGTGSIAGSAAVNQVNVTGGTPSFSGSATTVTVTGGGITTTGGTITTFIHSTGAGASTIGANTTNTTASIAAGTVNWNSTKTNGTLTVTGGTVIFGNGAAVGTADFSAGTGTANAANALTITNKLMWAGSLNAINTVPFTATGSNLANTNTASTLTLSGGTLAFSAPGNEGSGGTVTAIGGNVIHTFTSGNGSLTIPASVTSADVLVVAGGGGGGSWGGAAGGGGGAGGLIYRTGFAVTNGSPANVGGGGAGGPSGTGGYGSTGTDSVFGSLTALGGGGGAKWDAAGVSGGSGGGATGNGRAGGTATQPGSGSGGFGNVGASTSAPNDYYGGGGGAGTSGTTSNPAANGGTGLAYSICGTGTVYYAGGGASVGGNGGSGGGGAYGGVAGRSNTGGGGGAGNGGTAGGAGGSGIIIVSYPFVPGPINLTNTTIAAIVNSTVSLSGVSTNTLAGLNLGSAATLTVTNSLQLNITNLTVAANGENCGKVVATNGTINLVSGATLTVTGSPSASQITLISATTAGSSTFVGLPEGAAVPGIPYAISYLNNKVVLTRVNGGMVILFR